MYRRVLNTSISFNNSIIRTVEYTILHSILIMWIGDPRVKKWWFIWLYTQAEKGASRAIFWDILNRGLKNQQECKRIYTKNKNVNHLKRLSEKTNFFRWRRRRRRRNTYFLSSRPNRQCRWVMHVKIRWKFFSIF